MRRILGEGNAQDLTPKARQDLTPKAAKAEGLYAKKVLERFQSMTGQKPDLLAEKSYLGGKRASYGTAGSSRPDVFNPATGEIFDYKFVRNPGKGLSAAQRAKNAKDVPGVTKQTEINP
ncbi:MAG TPA: hypothetical protein VM493_00925 [Vicinamibacterales bacterium]|nr:hypothetical protein [Vicinamibacterales bacterium]